MNNTQIIKIKNRLKKYGEVSNLWAINNHMWRLGAIICRLREQGMDIVGYYLPKRDGTKSKVYNYKLVK